MFKEIDQEEQQIKEGKTVEVEEVDQVEQVAQQAVVQPFNRRYHRFKLVTSLVIVMVNRQVNPI